MKLAKTDTIITAFAERASGPGWANRLVQAVVRDSAGQLRIEYLQPEDHTAEIAALFDVSEAAHIAMMNAVKRKLKGGR